MIVREGTLRKELAEEVAQHRVDEFVDCAENAPVENQEMHRRPQLLPAQRAIAVGVGGIQMSCSDGAVDNRQTSSPNSASRKSSSFGR